jgi:hypothetical protein
MGFVTNQPHVQKIKFPHVIGKICHKYLQYFASSMMLILSPWSVHRVCIRYTKISFKNYVDMCHIREGGNLLCLVKLEIFVLQIFRGHISREKLIKVGTSIHMLGNCSWLKIYFQVTDHLNHAPAVSCSIKLLNISMYQITQTVPMTNWILFWRLDVVQTWFVFNSMLKRLKPFLVSLLHHQFFPVIWMVKEGHQFHMRHRCSPLHMFISIRHYEWPSHCY